MGTPIKITDNGKHWQGTPAKNLITQQQIDAALREVNDLLRFALNELRAIDSDEELPTDRKACAKKLRALADHLEGDGISPDSNAILTNITRGPIQK